jgi:hypothetical protein
MHRPRWLVEIISDPPSETARVLVDRLVRYEAAYDRINFLRPRGWCNHRGAVGYEVKAMREKLWDESIRCAERVALERYMKKRDAHDAKLVAGIMKKLGNLIEQHTT